MNPLLDGARMRWVRRGGGCPVGCGGPSRSGITWIPRTFVAETVLEDRLATSVERVSAVLAKHGVTGVRG